MRALDLPPALLPLALAACASDSIAPSRPGNYLVVLNKAEDTLSVIEPNSGHTRDQGPTGRGPHEAAASRDGRWVVVADHGDATPGHTLTVYDLAERRRSTTIDLAPHARPHGIAFLDDRSHVLVTSEATGSVLVVGIGSRRVERVIPTGGELPHLLALSPDRRHAYTSNLASGSVSQIDLERGALVRVVPTGPRPEAIAVSPDGRELWVGHDDGDFLAVLDARTMEPLAEVACGRRPIRLAFTRDGAHVLVSAHDSGELVVVDARARTELRRVPLAPPALPAAASADSSASPASPGVAAPNPAPVGLLVEPRGRFAFVALSAADLVAVVDLSTWTVRGHYRTGDEPDGMAWAYLWDPARLSGSTFLD